jgi:hypothetical protein
MENKYYASLQPSEMAIFRASANIFAGYVAAGKVGESNEGEMIKRSIESAIRMASLVEKSVQSDEEMNN